MSEDFEIHEHTQPIETAWIDFSELREMSGNPRIHSEKAIERLEQSITFFGLKRPIDIWKGKNVIVGGHARFKALRRLGVEKIPCNLMSFDNEEEARAYNIADNRTQELTEWNFPELRESFVALDTGAFPIEVTGFNQIELNSVFEFEGAETPDVETHGQVNENENFIIKCSDRDEIEKLQEVFKTTGQKIKFSDAWELLSKQL